MEKPEIEYHLRLRSKFGGDCKDLFERFATYDEAKARATDEHYCTRCNYIDVVPVEKGQRW